MARRRIPADPSGGREGGRPRGGKRPQRAAPAQRKSQRNRDYLAKLDEEEEYSEERPVYERRKRGFDAGIPVVLGICLVLAGILGVVIYQNPLIWDSQLRAAHETVKTTDKLDKMKMAVNLLIEKKDITGLRYAKNNFIKQIKKMPVEEADKWRDEVGKVLLEWYGTNDHKSRDQIEGWLQKGKVVWEGDKKEYDQIINELRDEAYNLTQIMDRDYFISIIKPMLDLTQYIAYPGEKRTTEEKQWLLKQALHFDWTEVKAYSKGAKFEHNENPSIRIKFWINDETYVHQFFVDFFMEKTDGRWHIKDAKLLAHEGE
ncbi:hypothetical protein ACFL54_03060 [Planctomycetota bacterium]